MKKFLPIIGCEIHIELMTKSKMFCGCLADHFAKKPNTLCCPVCLGLPGALPVPNKKAIEWTVMAGLALNCQIPSLSKFDRKNYFYPDLPKGYQISQYDLPLAVSGELKVRIRRVHLEEDTAKMIHLGNYTLIDFNRSGVPLMEIVTEPDLHSAEETSFFLKKLQQIIRYLGISEADMEKGQMRCEPTVNLKIKKNGKIFYTPLVELKNINSFRFVKKAIDYEIQRQLDVFNRTGETKKTGNKSTRGWSERKSKTILQRQKEEASDYRYFPEPDIPPIKWTNGQISNFKFLISKIELPDKKIARFVNQYNITLNQADILCETSNKADRFEEAVKKGKVCGITAKEIANQMINRPLQKLIKKTKPLVAKKEILKVVRQIIKENQSAVADYHKGKLEVIEFLVGQVMKKTRERVDPVAIRQIISRIVNSDRSRIGGRSG